MNNFYKSALFQMSGLKKEKPELTEIVDFYTSIFKMQEKAYSDCKPDTTHYNTDNGKNRNGKGLPFLTKEDILVHERKIKDLMINISKTIRKKKKQAIPEETDFAQLAAGYKDLLEGLLENTLILEKKATELNMEYQLFYFFINAVFSPFISKYAAKYREHIDFNKWLRGYCPVCGGKSLISKLDEETGRKWLLCSLCFTEWPFKRLACSFCDNEDQETLRFFYDEYDEAHRVDICDKCKGYMKTIDLRKLGREVNPFVENLSTLELDIVAEKEGFRGGFNVLI